MGIASLCAVSAVEIYEKHIATKADNALLKTDFLIIITLSLYEFLTLASKQKIFQKLLQADKKPLA